MPKNQLSKDEQQILENLRLEVIHWQKQGIHSLSKLGDLLTLMQSEGLSMSEVAGRAGTNRYNRLMQAVLDLGNGRAAKRGQAVSPQLVKTVATNTNHRTRAIALTAKGKRLRHRMLAFASR